ncbi:unnamed protein product [Triticum turgidum subsp. durum]|uniref:Anthranilate synthase n=1 Tax=Triticum turgidum subsp. durum TaxID=4567 RepID=A0A9R0TAD8_TRITD|nr:unnamed protein product [Triticum turgidum subsp. durum]
MESLAAATFSPSRLAAHPAPPAAAAAGRSRAVAARGRRRSSSGLRCSSASATPVINGSAAAKAEEEDRRRFFEAAARGTGKGNLVPVWECIVSDHLTPVLAYRCLVPEDDMDTPSFLFESVEQGLEGTTNVGRYSMVGAHPVMEVVAKENKVTIMDHEKAEVTEKIMDDPMQVPRSIMEGWHPQEIDQLPEAFSGGWVGFFSYDTVRYVEKKKIPFSGAPHDDRNLPDVHLGLYDDVLVFDNVEKKVYVIHWVSVDRHASTEEAYKDGRSRLKRLLSKVHNANVPKLSPGFVKLHTRQFGTPLNKSTMTSDEYKGAVMQAKEHILAGNIFQIVLSQRFERRTYATPFEVYRALRIVNPSPYMAYVQARGCILVASSPEILTKVEKQVSKSGSVKVEKLMNIERYSHVMHISSTVSGELDDRLESWDALRAALPVGTVSGAPKVKAMELIDQLEVTRRGPYSGGLGGISFDGDMLIALALRTIVFSTAPSHNTMYSYKSSDRRREWVAHLQAGAGIVADSIPDDEQKECENKAAALARAIDLAESAFVDKE